MNHQNQWDNQVEVDFQKWELPMQADRHHNGEQFNEICVCHYSLAGFWNIFVYFLYHWTLHIMIHIYAIYSKK